MSARERFFKKVQQNSNRVPPDKKSAEAEIREFCQRVDELAKQINAWFEGSGIEVIFATRHINDLSTIGYSLSSGICRYDITTVLLQNGERSASIIPEQLCQGAETGCVTMCVEAPGTRQVFHLSMAPETGWYLRGEHQSVCERVSMTEEGFFQAVDRLA
ncbi:hypothetical protein [Atlantibacter hermannii]|uniref:Uncharacterized protein n=1 Tax=Atlantibacter hermannii NBRC 105704 TaxID=1115512 RepID=H5UXJ1_ATLHE|nr:hypothetical protein [Atlantibacter hermannii]MDU7814176.1 hypothetical protein [Atlantibacter hermannii]QPS90543.1 hypothetical protein I6G45_13380 [Atlantibacter hermannii]GAB50622.1 hypothetical protein EH105704_01_06320 [Atlantibacter hermannii NBRC 105704]VDZ72554.1 Uncharacterised protein [Atlantibacter hermannii]